MRLYRWRIERDQVMTILFAKQKVRFILKTIGTLKAISKEEMIRFEFLNMIEQDGWEKTKKPFAKCWFYLRQWNQRAEKPCL